MYINITALIRMFLLVLFILFRYYSFSACPQLVCTGYRWIQVHGLIDYVDFH